MRFFALALVVASTLWLLIWTWPVFDTLLSADPPVRAKALRRVARTVAVWELTVAFELAILQGWEAITSVVALAGVAVYMLFIPSVVKNS